MEIFKNSDKSKEELQVSPGKSIYDSKYGAAISYDSKDIQSSGHLKNIRINDTTGVSEPHIKCSPRNKKILAVSANDFSENSESGCIFVSEDGGLNWQTRRVPLSDKFKRSSYSDPWLDFDSEGNLYYTAVQFDLSVNSKEGIYITCSSDNGNTWKTDFNFVDYNSKENIQIDRSKIFIDKSSVRKNTIYVSWNELKGFNSYLMFSKSTDGGITFSAPVTVDRNDIKYCSITGDKSGNLYLVYMKDGNKINVKKSDDGGLSWWKESVYTNISPAGVKDQSQYILKGKNGIRVNSEPSVVISGNDELLITYSALGKNNDLSDIYFTALKQGVSDLTIPVKVNTDETENDQFFPTITTDESGMIIIMYQDSRNDINNVITETFVSYSSDGGLTFQDKKFTTSPSDPLEIAVNRYIGDYNSCVVSDGNLVGVWTDGRNKNFDIYAGIFSLNEINDVNENKNH